MKQVVKSIRTIVDKMESGPRFYAGNFDYISNQLSLLGLDAGNDLTKYPLIFLDTDTEESRGEQTNVGCETTITLYFIKDTNKDYSDEECIDNNFITTLVPLFDEFFASCYRSNEFVFDNIVRMQKSNFLPMKTKNLYRKIFVNDIVDALKIDVTLKFSNY
jgi:hypothetical protein